VLVVHGVERLLAVGGLEDPKTGFFEACSAKRAYGAVVVDDEDGLRGSSGIRGHALEA